MKYDRQMDPQCIIICNAINDIKDLETTESCCGHNKDPFMVFFRANDFGSLFLLGRAIHPTYGGPIPMWNFYVDITDASNKAVFRLESYSIGSNSYHQSNQIAQNIYNHLFHNTFIKGFELEDFQTELP